MKRSALRPVKGLTSLRISAEHQPADHRRFFTVCHQHIRPDLGLVAPTRQVTQKPVIYPFEGCVRLGQATEVPNKLGGAYHGDQKRKVWRPCAIFRSKGSGSTRSEDQRQSRKPTVGEAETPLTKIMVNGREQKLEPKFYFGRTIGGWPLVPPPGVAGGLAGFVVIGFEHLFSPIRNMSPLISFVGGDVAGRVFGGRGQHLDDAHNRQTVQPKAKMECAA